MASHSIICKVLPNQVAVLALVSSLAGCGGPSYVLLTCERDERDIISSDFDFSEDDIMEMVSSYAPVEIQWDVSANDMTTATNLVIARSSEKASAVTYGGPPCRTLEQRTIGLTLPVNVELHIGAKDDVTASLAGVIEAHGVSLDRISFYDVNGEAELSSEWLSDAQHSYSPEMTWPPDSWEVGLSDTLEDARITIAAHKNWDVGNIWAGHLLPADASGD